jgi:uncharacterized protein (DUF1330 family)
VHGYVQHSGIKIQRNYVLNGQEPSSKVAQVRLFVAGRRAAPKNGAKEARMGAQYKIGLAMLSCVAIGALATEALHAQARPPAYLIGQIDVSNPRGYADEYLPRARKIIKAHGGRLVAAAGAAATGSQVVAIDGEAPKRVVIYMYPSMEALQAWRNDPEYVEVRRVGEKYANYHTFAVEGAVGSSP